MPALPLCIDQMYSDGNKSDYQRKMHGIKQKVYFTVFCPVFPLRTACVLRATFTSFTICQGKENFTQLGFLQPRKIGGEKSWFLWHFHQTHPQKEETTIIVLLSLRDYSVTSETGILLPHSFPAAHLAATSLV